MQAPLIVAIGGTLRAGSSTERALRVALSGAAEAGARTLLIAGPALELPLYAPERTERGPAATELVAALRSADGVILGSPGYHGGVSGLIKNALDYVEDLAADRRPYFDGRAVGSVATAAGWQAAVAALTQLRAIVHALRGWNTPVGVALNSAEPLFDAQGECLAARDTAMLKLVGAQVTRFAGTMPG